MSGVDLNLVTVIVAGLIDGINPCAIAVLLVFVSATLLAVGATMEGSLADRRRALFKGERRTWPACSSPISLSASA